MNSTMPDKNQAAKPADAKVAPAAGGNQRPSGGPSESNGKPDVAFQPNATKEKESPVKAP